MFIGNTLKMDNWKSADVIRKHHISEWQVLQLISDRPDIYYSEIAELFGVGRKITKRKLDLLENEAKKHTEEGEKIALLLKKSNKARKHRRKAERDMLTKADYQHGKVTKNSLVKYLMENKGESSEVIGHSFGVSGSTIRGHIERLIQWVLEKKDGWFLIKSVLMSHWGSCRRRTPKIHKQWRNEQRKGIVY